MFDDDLLGDPQNIEEIVEDEIENAFYLEADENADSGVIEENDERPASPTGDGGKVKEVKKKTIQRPQPKLNPERLRGPRGIAVLETVFKDFKFCGKGHEKEDLDQVMKRLELWAHRLYPRFQFDDCLEKIETLGHKKPVMTYVKKIRMGMVTADEPLHLPDEINDEEETALDDEPPIDEFDALISQQLSHIQTKPPVPQAQPASQSSLTLTEEQRERMLRNRLLAEERRLAKLKTQKEKDIQNEKDSSVESEELPELESSEDTKKSEESLPPVVLEQASLS